MGEYSVRFSKLPGTVANDGTGIDGGGVDWSNINNVKTEDTTFANVVGYEYGGMAPP